MDRPAPQEELGVSLLFAPERDCSQFAGEIAVSATPEASGFDASSGGESDSTPGSCGPPTFDVNFASRLDLVDEVITIETSFDDAVLELTTELVVSGDAALADDAPPSDATIDGVGVGDDLGVSVYLLLDGGFVGDVAGLDAGATYDQIVVEQFEVGATPNCSDNLQCPDRRFIVGTIDFDEDQTL